MTEETKAMIQNTMSQLPVDMASLDIFNVDKSLESVAAGMLPSISILSFRGSKWSVIQGGESRPLLNADGTPKTALPAVLINSAPHLSKTFYEGGYEEGSDAPPDCMSHDGVYPDKTSESIQAASCAACKWNQFGTDPVTGKGKACRDYKLVGVLAAEDMNSGPYMLRVPAMSHMPMRQYHEMLASQGFTGAQVITQLSFDPEASYPKIVFKYLGALKPDALLLVAKQYPAAKALLGAPVPSAKEETAPAAEKPKKPRKPRKTKAQKEAEMAAANAAAESAANTETPAPVAETPPENVVPMQAAPDPVHDKNTQGIADLIEGLDSIQ